MRIGIMQGRLVTPENGKFQSFPAERWRDEFPRALDAGVDYIEWIVDSVAGNPIFTASGRDEMLWMKQKWNIDIPSICCDWFMEHPLRENCLKWSMNLSKMMILAGAIGARRLIIPFVDNSSIKTADDAEMVLTALRFVGGTVEIHLECDLPPKPLREMLDRLPDHILANWDSGNSSGLGYKAREEFTYYGARIGSIHIKDRLRLKDGGVKTMPLGEGSANFDDVFSSIHRIGYDGDLTLQVARGEDGDEVNWIRKQAEFVRERFLCVK